MSAVAPVYAIPLRTRFRGITLREGVLLHGDAGWGEFSPFRDYDDREALRWWPRPGRPPTCGFPTAVRDRIPVNVTVPAVGPQEAAGRRSAPPAAAAPRR